MQTKIEVRLARAEDVDQVVELIYSAAPELFDYMFTVYGKTAHDFIRYEFVQGGGFMGHRVHKVAVDGDTVKGIGVFYTGEPYHRLSLQTAWNVLRFYGLCKGINVLYRAEKSHSIIAKPKKSELYIADLGVAEHSRSQGIGTLLIDYHKDLARTQGLDRLVLDVATNNPRAEALYQQLGFEVTKEYQFKGGAGSESVPNARRMIYNIK